MKRNLFIFVCLMLAVASCGRSGLDAEKLRKAEKLGGPGLDAADLAIVAYALNNPSLGVDLSMNLKQRLARYNGNTNFKITADKIGQKPIKGKGVQGIKLILQPESKFDCDYEGALQNRLSFQNGEVGIVDGGIYIKEGTRMSLDGTVYTFFEGFWRKSG
jgi:hypothetical protein